MATITYTSHKNIRTKNPAAKDLQQIFLSPPPHYWSTGNGGILLDYEDGARDIGMVVLQNDTYGFYVKYIDEGGQPWLSVHDATKLGQITIGGDSWRASIGLFLPAKEAWKAVECFLATGQRSDQIAWIRPSELPSTGNW
jgi:hypothetical protein